MKNKTKCRMPIKREWNEWLLLVKEYLKDDKKSITRDTTIELNGEEIKIGLWVKRQIIDFEKLTLSQKKELENIPVIYSKLTTKKEKIIQKSWDQRYSLLCKFLETNTTIKVRDTIRDMSIIEPTLQEDKIGYWVDEQLKPRVWDTLSTEQKDKLEINK